MADYKGEPSGYAAATTPLSNLGAGEPAYAVQIHGDNDASVHKATTTMNNTMQVPAYAPPPQYSEAALPAAHTVHSVAFIQRGQWSAGLCGCFDFCVPNCCMATFCPCISAAQIASRVGYSYVTVLICYAILVVADLVLYSLGVATFNGSVEYYYSSHYYYYSYNYMSEYKLTVWGHLAYIVSIVLFIAYWHLRSRVRRTFELPGSCIGDCCTTFFCSCCSLAQMATHVKSYKPHSCDFGPPDELAAYNDQ